VGPDLLMPRVVDRLRDLLGDRHAPILGIGLSLPGTLDPVRCLSIGSPVMSGWDGVELAPYFAALGGAPLFVANDADVLARSELLGNAGPRDDVLVVKASTGLGLGIVADGRVLSGHLGAAGEIGHTTVDAAGDLPCRCGATGCLETIAGGWALVARMAAETEQSGQPVDHVRDLVALALQGDSFARGLLRDSGRELGEVLAVAINLLNPAAVVIGGDMAAAFDFYVAGVRESVYRRSAPLATRDLQFLPAVHGDRAGVVGCGALALDHVLAPVAVDARLAGLS
jgi:predicted NBD/HSP70 family sugar kinase